ncbi:MAG: GNAT family N-acetyltransferase [Bryobacteraceae bacterium]
MNLSVEIIRASNSFPGMEADWRRLWSLTPSREIFYSWEWAEAWWKSYKASCDLFVPVVRRDGMIISILPLVREGRRLRFLGHNTTDYNTILCAGPDTAAALEASLNALLQEKRDWDEAILVNISDRSAALPAINALPRNLSSRMIVGPTLECPAVVFGEAQVEQIAALRKKESLRRHRKKLAKLGDITFRHLTSRAEIGGHFQGFIDAHRARRALAGDASLFHDSRSVDFYRALIDGFDPETILRFGVVSVNAKAVAYHLGFELEGKFIWYKPAFDVELWDLGPGEVLLDELFRYCGEAQSTEFDFTQGGESFKLRFANTIRLNHNIRFYPAHLRGRLFKSVQQVREWLRSRPKLEARVRGCLDAGSNLIQKVRRHGASGAARKVALKLRKRVWDRRETLIFLLSPKPPASPVVNGIELKALSFGYIASMASDFSDYLSREKLIGFRQRMKSCHRGYAAFVDGKLCHLAWTRSCTEISGDDTGKDLKLQLPRAGTLIYDCWTPPLQRGKGIYPAVLRGIAEIERSAGNEDIWIFCDEWNKASANGIRKAGFHLAARLYKWVLAGRVVKKGIHRVFPH